MFVSSKRLTGLAEAIAGRTRSRSCSLRSRAGRGRCSRPLRPTCTCSTPAREELEAPALRPTARRRARAHRPRRARSRGARGASAVRGSQCRSWRATSSLGLLVAEDSSDVELARAVASQAAVGIKKVQLIERLTEENLIKDFFEELAARPARARAGGRAARLGLRPRPAAPRARRGAARRGARARAARSRPGSLVRPAGTIDPCALLRVPVGRRRPAARRRSGARTSSFRRRCAVGLSSPSYRPARRSRTASHEARQALLGATLVAGTPSLVSYEELGAYKYLLRIAGEGGVRDATVDAVTRLADYDRRSRRRAAADARGVPAAPREHQRDVRGALRASEHAPPAAAPHRRPLRPRPAPRRLADGRDRGQARRSCAAATGPVGSDTSRRVEGGGSLRRLGCRRG